MEKFKSQLVTDNSSVCSDPSPKTSFNSHHRITPSNLTVDHTGVVTGAGGKRVTTAAIVTHEMDPTSTLVRKSSRASLSKASNSQEWRAVKWKDREEAASASASASEAITTALTASPPASAVTAGTPLKDVNASLARLDRKIMHLETLLAKLTDRLSQQQSSMDSNEVHQHSQASN